MILIMFLMMTMMVMIFRSSSICIIFFYYNNINAIYKFYCHYNIMPNPFHACHVVIIIMNYFQQDLEIIA